MRAPAGAWPMCPGTAAGGGGQPLRSTYWVPECGAAVHSPAVCSPCQPDKHPLPRIMHVVTPSAKPRWRAKLLPLSLPSLSPMQCPRLPGTFPGAAQDPGAAGALRLGPHRPQVRRGTSILGERGVRAPLPADPSWPPAVWPPTVRVWPSLRRQVVVTALPRAGSVCRAPQLREAHLGLCPQQNA